MYTASLKKNFGKSKTTNLKPILAKNKMLLFLTISLLIGVFLGAVLINLADENALKVINALFLSDFKERLTRPLLDIFIASVASVFIFVIIAFFMGLSMWGFVLAPIIPFARGVCIGLCEGYMYSVYGLKGIFFHSLIFLPGIFISTIAVLLMTRESMKLSKHFSTAVFSNNENSMALSLKNYILRSSFITIIVLISSVVDLISNLFFSKFFAF